jgi:hypothetical protein
VTVTVLVLVYPKAGTSVIKFGDTDAKDGDGYSGRIVWRAGRLPALFLIWMG